MRQGATHTYITKCVNVFALKYMKCPIEFEKVHIIGAKYYVINS